MPSVSRAATRLPLLYPIFEGAVANREALRGAAREELVDDLVKGDLEGPPPQGNGDFVQGREDEQDMERVGETIYLRMERRGAILDHAAKGRDEGESDGLGDAAETLECVDERGAEGADVHGGQEAEVLPPGRLEHDAEEHVVGLTLSGVVDV